MEKKSLVVNLFDSFLAEVRLTYGQKIADICRDKLLLIDSVEGVDELAILAEAKREAGFKPELSSLANTESHFVT